MSTVADLQPGDLVLLQGVPLTGVFVATAPHPVYSGLLLVVWKLSDGTWSFDALSAAQYIGEIQPTPPQQRGRRLMEVLDA